MGRQMVLGFPVTPLWMLGLGLPLYALVVFEILVGLRKIKLGRRTFVYHKYIAYTILGIGTVHGTLGILFLTGWRLF